MLRQTSWQESSPKINFLLCVWKIAKSISTLHHLHLRLRLKNDFERKHILEIRPSVTLAKNVKRKELVFALLNREIIEAMWGQLIGSDELE